MDVTCVREDEGCLDCGILLFGGRSGVGGGLGCRGAGASELRRDGDGRWLCGLCDCHPLWRRASFLPWQ